MKIVLFVGHPSPPLIYFVNKINERFKVDLVVVQEHKIEASKKAISSRFLLKNTLDMMRFAFRNKKNFLLATKHYRHRLRQKRNEKIIAQEKERKTAEEEFFAKRWFGNFYENFNPDIPIVRTFDNNAPEIQEKIAEIKPDALLMHGGSILKDEIIAQSSFSLNLHWGLSPYYRGSNCTKHAIINRDFNNIGVTVHRPTSLIDGGEILAQARAEIKTPEDLRSANYQLTYLGTDIMLKVLENFDKKEQFVFKTQDISLGFNFRADHLKSICGENFFEKIQDESVLNNLLKKPTRQKLPIVDFEIRSGAEN